MLGVERADLERALLGVGLSADSWSERAVQLLERKIPILKGADYRIVGRMTVASNCIAWTLGDEERWWWPIAPRAHWPEAADRALTLECFAAMYESQGFVRCEDGEPVTGTEKVALYANDAGEPTHAARLGPDGKWTSKLGNLQAIEHALALLEGDPARGAYGRVRAYFVRARSSLCERSEFQKFDLGRK